MRGAVDDLLARAVHATRAAGTARIAHSLRRDTPSGAVADRHFGGTGTADLARLAAIVRDDADAGAGTYLAYDGGTVLAGPTRRGRWLRLPFPGAPDGRLATTAPLWLLDGEDRVRPGAVALGPRRWRDEAVHAYRGALHDGDAEIWIGADGTIRLFAARVPNVPVMAAIGRLVLRRGAARWQVGTDAHPLWRTTELWDLGCGSADPLPADDEIDDASPLEAGRLFDRLMRRAPRA